MERRGFLKLMSAGTATAASAGLVWRYSNEANVAPIMEDMPVQAGEIDTSIQYLTGSAPKVDRYLDSFEAKHIVPGVNEVNLEAYLRKMQDFENSHVEDVYLEYQKFPILISSYKRIERVQKLVGHGNFNVLGFDEMIRFSRNYSSIGAFPKAELDFLEGIFSDNVTRYGFYGDKVIHKVTAVVQEKDRIKVGNTGHFLFRGRPLEVFSKLQKDLGEAIELTSGIRSVVKQTYLFLAKTIQSKGNLSRASRSLAPPGHSFHGIGDFDVGKKGFGAMNFTAEFAKTAEFKRLVDLGYVDMRYPEKNLLGVRYEPWHIKVV